MDQLKVIFNAAKKHHFWILCVTIMLLTFVGWYLSTGKLAAAYDSRNKKLEDNERTMEAVSRKVNHPNENIRVEMDQLLRARREVVRSAWEIKWKRYEEILVWPPELTTDFVASATKLRPIENFTPKDPKNSIHSEALAVKFRREYWNYVRDELPKLADVIGSHWRDPKAKTAAGGNRASRRPRHIDDNQTAPHRTSKLVVDWNAENQSDIETRHFYWRGVPTTGQVLYAQEDLWVLRALMDIIAATNKGTKTQSTAAVKVIQSIQLGKYATQPKGAIHLLVDSKSKDEEKQKLGNEKKGTPDQEEINLADGRYVDEKYEPLMADDLQKVGSSKPLLAIAKRMPIRMRLIIDQRKLSDLLIECGNSTLIVEVRQVLFNPGATFEGKLEQKGGEKTRGREMGPSIASSRPADGRSTSNYGGSQSNQNNSFERPVELYGIIYIYNPVNNELLGIEESQSG
ncbi:MAG: hypothetical protein CMJ62_07315 [Planctomycetaceae bacterium]|nr:hypothetical protein [Planctomycetaceae bacterium]